MSKKIKVFGRDGFWIDGCEFVGSVEEADVVVMPGGADWDPALYNEKVHPSTYFYKDSDYRQMEIIKEAIEKKKLLFGICRGLQGVSIAAGAKLIQDIDHPGRHLAFTKEGEAYVTNSLHHQMCYPYDLPEDEYDVLTYSKQLSPYHKNGENQQMEFPPHSLTEDGFFKEPETIYYPKIRALGAQGHPEGYGQGETFVKLMNHYIKTYLNV